MTVDDRERLRKNVADRGRSWTIADAYNKRYYGFDGYGHTPRVVDKMAAYVITMADRRVFSNAKRWQLGVFHGFRERYLGAYLNEFVFRWNRRRTLSIGVRPTRRNRRRRRTDIIVVAADEWSLVAPMRGSPISDPHPAFFRRIVHRVGCRVGKPGN
jgi:hypothetical protein